MKRRNLITWKLYIMILLIAGIFAQSKNTYVYAIEQAPSNFNQIKPYYNYITNIGASISISNSGYATCMGSLTIYSNYSSTLTITLQRSKDSKNWSNVKTWSSDFDGIGVHSLEKGYYVSSGYTYRVVNEVKIQNGNNILETATIYSKEISY